MKLEEAGFRAAEGGEVLLAGPAGRLFEAWSRYLRRLLRPFYDRGVRAPLFLAGRVLEDAGYLQHFPQHPFRCGNAMGVEARYVTPAACLHLYPALAGQALSGEPVSTLILARCARYEGGSWAFPFRLAAFHMLELVVIGEREAVARRRQEVEALLDSAFGVLGLRGAFEPATDAFFLGNDEGARIVQKLKGLKREYVVPCGDERVAAASINDHEDYFGRRFGLAGGDGGFGGLDRGPAHSFCAAFGLERLTACGLLAWGAEAAGWPGELQT